MTAQKAQAALTNPSPTAQSWGVSFPGSDTRKTAVGTIAVDPEGADELVDLTSIFADLVTASMAAHGIQHDSIQGSGHLFIRRACWEGAIVAYGRCFALGRKPGGKKRHTLFSYLKHLSDEQVETHHFVRALRNRRVGHHDQDGSGTTLDMYLTIGSLQGTHMEISDICVDYRGEFYDVELLARLEDLTQRLRELVGSRIDDLRFELQAELCADVGAVITAWRSATPLARPSSQG